jgi:hypothetical protein
MLFQRKHLLAASQMEARWRVEVTGVLIGGAELADNEKLSDDAQRVGVGAARAHSARRGRVVGAWRSPVCTLTARSWTA